MTADRMALLTVEATNRALSEQLEIALADAAAGRMHVAALLGMRDEKAMSSWKEQDKVFAAQQYMRKER